MNTIYDWVFRNETDKNKVILSTQSGQYTNLHIQNRVEFYINKLSEFGDLHGKKVGLIIPNVSEYLSLVLAVNKLGGSVVPLSLFLRKEDLKNILDFVNPHIVFSINEHNSFPFFETVLLWAKEKKERTILFHSDDCKNWQPIVISGEEKPLVEEKIDIIGCTSGSTGTPKGIVINLDYFETIRVCVESATRLNDKDNVLLVVPTTSLFGLSWLLGGIHLQSRMNVTESFHFPDIVQFLKLNKSNIIATTPSIYKAIYSLVKDVTDSGFENIKIASLTGENITEDYINQISDIQNCKIITIFGMTELGGMMFTKNDIRQGIEWSLVPGVEYHLHEENEDGIGEILFNSPSGFKGYYGRPDLTEEVYRDGWFYTGDLARKNSAGNIEIVGRKKDMIKKGGQQVIPGEIEQILTQYDGIQKAVVIGIPHHVFGEQIVAFVTGEKPKQVHDLYSFCKSKIANYKVPDQIYFIDEIPIRQGKIDKITLKEIALKRISLSEV